jgi:hypothetical protein
MRHQALIAAALVLASSAASHAATLLTPPLFVGTNPTGQLIRCTIANVSSVDPDVTIEIVSASGTTVVSTPVNPLGARRVVTEAWNAPGSYYCRFQTKGSSRQYRAAGTVGTVGSESVFATAN